MTAHPEVYVMEGENTWDNVLVVVEDDKLTQLTTVSDHDASWLLAMGMGGLKKDGEGLSVVRVAKRHQMGSLLLLERDPHEPETFKVFSQGLGHFTSVPAEHIDVYRRSFYFEVLDDQDFGLERSIALAEAQAEHNEELAERFRNAHDVLKAGPESGTRAHLLDERRARCLALVNGDAITKLNYVPPRLTDWIESIGEVVMTPQGIKHTKSRDDNVARGLFVVDEVPDEPDKLSLFVMGYGEIMRVSAEHIHNFSQDPCFDLPENIEALIERKMLELSNLAEQNDIWAQGFRQQAQDLREEMSGMSMEM